MSVVAMTREGSASVTREHKFLSINRGNLCVQKLRCSISPVREKRKVNAKDKRRETTRECRGTSSIPRLASLSAALFPGRNECPGTHCGLIVQEEKEDSSCQICQRD